MSLLTLLGSSADNPFVETFTATDGSNWSQTWSTEGDAPNSFGSDFESQSLTPWSTGSSWTSSIVAGGHSSNYAAKVVRNTATAGNGYFLNSTLLITAGNRNFITAWVYATNPTTYSFKVQPKTSGNVAAGAAVVQSFVPPVGQWYRATIYFVAGATATNADFYITDDANLKPILNSYLLIDSIEQGVLKGTPLLYYGDGWIQTASGTANQPTRMDLTNGPSLGDTDFLIQVSPVTAGVQQTVYLGINGSSSGIGPYSIFGYALVLDYTAGDTSHVTLSIRGRISGFDTLIAGPVTVPIATGNTFSYYRFQRIGHKLQARAWIGTEPTTWQLSGTITDATPATGVVSVAALTDNAGVSQQIFYDNATVSAPAGPVIIPSGPVTRNTVGTMATAASSPLTLTIPTNKVGDILLMAISTAGSGTVSTPAGWTLVGSSAIGGTSLAYVFWKYCNTVQSGTVAVTTSGTSTKGIIISYSGADSSVPTGVVTSGNTSSSALTAPSQLYQGFVFWMSTAASSAAMSAEASSSGTWTFSEALDSAGTPSLGVVDGPITANTTASLSLTHSTTNHWSSVAVSLVVPVSAGGTTGQIKVWDGSSHLAKPAKVWDGSSFTVKQVKIWDGSAWVPTNY